MSKKYTTNFLEDTNGSTGSANQVLVSTAAGVDWVDGSGSGIIGGPYLPLTGGTLTGNLKIDQGAVAGNPRLTFDHDNFGTSAYYIEANRSSDFLNFVANGGSRLTLSSTAATFAGDLTVSGGDITLGGATGRIQGIDTISSGTDAVNRNYVDTEIANIPSGLAFEGNWNASTDTPTLAGTTQDNGKFWIVTVAGSTNLSGITDWAVGDWAIYVDNGAGTDAWQKVDNSSTLSGLGAAGKVAFWSTTSNVSFNNNFSYDGTYLTSPRIRVGDGTDGFFYSDSAGRTAFTGGDFYIQSVSNAYNYATNNYHGNTSGDNQLFRGNPLSGNNWNITAAGAISASSTIYSAGGFLVPYAAATKKPMINLAGATTYGLWHTEGSDDIFSFDFGGVSKQQFFQSGNATFAGDLTVSGGDITLGGTGRIQGVDTVSASTDAANKAYVDNAIAGVPQGTVTGSGVNQRLAFWNGTSSLSSDDELTWDGVNLNIGTYAGTGDCELRLFGSTPNNSFSTLKTTNGNLHIDSDNGHTVYLNYYSGGSTSVIIGNGAGGSSNTVFYANGNVGVGADLTVSGGDITLSGTGRIQGVDTVSAGTDAANKAYVDGLANDDITALAFSGTTTQTLTATQRDSSTLTASFNISKTQAGGTGPSAENLNTVANNVTVGQMEYRGFNNSSSNAPPTSNNANGVISVGQHSGNYGAQLAFSSNGNMYWRDNPSTSFGSWRTMWDSGNDGAGSGLDADLLDGQQGSYYASAASLGNYLPLAGGVMTGKIKRSSAIVGFLEGSYNNVGDNSANTNPIYTIGSSYNPSSTTLSNMYGIGYTHGNNASFMTLSGATGWGMYVASDGDARVWLDGGNGNISHSGDLYVGGGDIILAGTGRIRGVDTVSASTDAANKAYVDAHGGGLGPFLPLAGGSSVGQAMTGTLHGPGATFYVSGNNSSNLKVGDGSFRMEMGRSSIQARVVGVSGAASSLNLNPNGGDVLFPGSGDVGIGMTSPLHRLSIENSSSPLIKIRNTTNGDGAAIEFNDNGTSAATQNGRISYYHADGQSQGGGSSFWLTGEDDQTLVLANNGRVVVQRTGSSTEVGYGFYDDINTGMYRIGADNLGFATGGVNRLNITNALATFSGDLTVNGGDIILGGVGRVQGIDTVSASTDAVNKAYVDNNAAPYVTFTRTGINSSTYTMIATVNGDLLASIIKMTMTGTSGSVVFACTFDITVNHSQDIHVKSMNGDYTEVTLRITSDNNEDYSIEAKHNGGSTTTAEVCIFPLANEIITPTTTDPGYTGAEYEHTATEGWRFGGEDNNAESSNVIVDGKIGIGTTSPGSSLDVFGTIRVSDGTDNGNLLFRTDRSDVYIKENNYQLTFGAPSGMVFETDTNNNNGDTFRINHRGSARFYLDGTSGNVGIGTTSPDAKLDIEGDFEAGYALKFTNTKGTGSVSGFRSHGTNGEVTSLYRNSTEIQGWNENGNSYFGGNVGIGTGSPTSALGSTKVLDISSTGNGEVILDHTDAGTASDLGLYSWARNNDHLAHIKATCDGSTSAAFISFHAQPSGGSFANASSNEKMRIKSNGYVGIGTTSPDLKLDVVSGTNNGIRISATDTTSNWRDISIRSYVSETQADALGEGTHIYTSSPSGTSTETPFSYYGATVIQGRDNGNGGLAVRLGNGTGFATRMWIGATGVTVFSNTVTATNFILSSDERLKENIEKACDNRIKADWKTFELKTDKGQKRYGVIAQELEKTNPEFVREDTQGFKSVAYIDLLIAKIAELEARLEKAGI